MIHRFPFSLVFHTTWLHAAKDISCYVTLNDIHQEVQVSKLPPDISHSTIIAVQNKLKSMGSPNEEVTTRAPSILPIFLSSNSFQFHLLCSKFCSLKNNFAHSFT